MTTTGRFYGVGLGPGDPELVTLKAARLIGEADVVDHAGQGSDQPGGFDPPHRIDRSLCLAGHRY